MARRLIVALAAWFAAVPGIAAPVAIEVRGIDGKPLAGAVVTLEGPQMPAGARAGSYSIEQRNISFQPHVLIVPVGATVAFPNRDRVRHHVYSFSKAKKFDLKLYGREDQRSILFDRPGVVALGCNIHDRMSAFVIVSPSAFAAQTDETGRVRFADVPPGAATVRIWHPAIRATDNSTTQRVAVPASGVATTLTIGR